MTIDRTQTQYHDKTGTHVHKIGVATGPASYTTGGDLTVTPALFGLGRLDLVLFEPFFNGTNIFLVKYNAATSALQFFDPSTKAEAGAATNFSAFTARFLAIGTP
jgi:hypothetical protein